MPPVLLVEDDPDAALLFRRAFAKACQGWSVEHARNGLMAIDWILERGLPVAVVTDLEMPAMDGYELIAWIRAEQREHQSPIYVMSGSLDAATVDRCRELGADAFIPKQCCLDELRSLLCRLFPASQPATDEAGLDQETRFPASREPQFVLRPHYEKKLIEKRDDPPTPAQAQASSHRRRAGQSRSEGPVRG